MKYPNIKLKGEVTGQYMIGNRDTGMSPDQLAIAVRYPDFASFYGGVFSFPLKMTTRQALDAFEVDSLRDIVGKTVYLHPYKTGRGYSTKFQISLPKRKVTEYYGH